MKRRHSIRIKIVALPLVLVFLSVAILSFFSNYTTYSRTLEQKRLGGLAVAQQIRARLATNSQAIAALEEALTNTALHVAEYVASVDGEITDEFLTQIAEHLGADILNWYDPTGVLLHSAYGRQGVGMATVDVGVRSFTSSRADFWIEPIRFDSASGSYYIFAYKRAPGDFVVQVGINAQRVQALKEELSAGQLVVDVTSGATLSYANVFDAAGELEAASHGFSRQQSLQDAAKANALQNRSNYLALAKHPLTGELVWDIMLPVYANEEYRGAVNVGVNLEIVERTMRSSILMTLAVSGTAYVLLGLILSFNATRLAKSIDQVVKHVNLIGDKILGQPVPASVLKRKDELGIIARGIQAMQDSLSAVLGRVFEAAASTARASDELSASTEETSASIMEVAGTANQFASTVQTMGGSVADMVRAAEGIQASASEGQETVGRAVALADETKRNMAELAASVSHLSESSQEIGKIVEAITEIADQTNLLALNAAIEAARAGEYGRGFAVVAEEVRKLAEQASASAKQVTQLVHTIQGDAAKTVVGIKRSAAHAEESATAVVTSGELLTAILKQIAEITGMIREVSRGLELINAGSQELAAATEEQSASMQNIASAAQQLSDMSEQLQQLVREFELEVEEGKV